MGEHPQHPCQNDKDLQRRVAQARRWQDEQGPFDLPLDLPFDLPPRAPARVYYFEVRVVSLGDVKNEENEENKTNKTNKANKETTLALPLLAVGVAAKTQTYQSDVWHPLMATSSVSSSSSLLSTPVPFTTCYRSDGRVVCTPDLEGKAKRILSDCRTVILADWQTGRLLHVAYRQHL